jgi:hypothetical protein
MYFFINKQLLLLKILFSVYLVFLILKIVPLTEGKLCVIYLYGNYLYGRAQIETLLTTLYN